MFLVESPSEVLGYLSICCWLCAQFPQIAENIKQQSCESLALPFLFSWMLGDASNLLGCILTHQLPFQTYLATYFCFIDLCLLCQYFYYGGSPKSPPVIHPHTRARTTSSARRLSVDTSHYRSVSTTTGHLATAAALTAHSDTHPEHRRPRKSSINEQSVSPHPSEEPQDEVSDAMLSALSDSFHSESGQRKRVLWMQERHDHPPSGPVRRHVSPVAPATLRNVSASAAAAFLARGRPPRREEEAEDMSEEQEVQTEGRNTSRASRRSLVMVMLGIGMLFGVGKSIGGARPATGNGIKTGTVLAPTSNLDFVSTTGPPVLEGHPNQLTAPQPFSVNVELPAYLDGVLFSQRQPNDDMDYDRIIGRIFAWMCTTLYLTSRLPQIWKNYVRKSVEGLSIYLFVFAFLGNFFYVLSIVTSREALLPPPVSTEFYRETLPYLLGSGGTFVFDITIVCQSFIYKGKHPRKNYIRGRGDSLIQNAALAEETAGLLRGDTLATTRSRIDKVAVPRS